MSHQNGISQILVLSVYNVHFHSPLLSFAGPPHFISQPRSRVALQGERTTFSCHAGGYPPPTVTWFRNDQSQQPLQQNARLLLSPYGDLTLVGVMLKDDGTYRCLASNAKGSVQAFAVLTVHGKWAGR